MENSIFLTTDLSIVPESVTPDILFSDFYRIYYADMEGRLKQTTLAHKDAVIRDKILPTFGALPMNAITPQIIRRWQTGLLSGGYRDTYLKTIDMHLSSIFKYAAKYYDFPNPCAKAEHIGSGNARSMQFWTLPQYRAFIREFKDQPMVFTAFELLYWCGIRVGELLALTPQDIDEKKHLLKITKTYIRHDGKDIVSPPKTENSIRNVAMPDFLFSEVMDYIRDAGLKKNERIIPRSVDFLKYQHPPLPCLPAHQSGLYGSRHCGARRPQAHFHHHECLRPPLSEPAEDARTGTGKDARRDILSGACASG